MAGVAAFRPGPSTMLGSAHGMRFGAKGTLPTIAGDLSAMWGIEGCETRRENDRNRDRDARYRSTPGRRPSPPITDGPCRTSVCGDPRIDIHLRATERELSNTTSRNRSTSSNRTHPQLTKETPMTARRRPAGAQSPSSVGSLIAGAQPNYGSRTTSPRAAEGLDFAGSSR
jgi:hypothetical protein